MSSSSVSVYGKETPFSEPYWYQGFESPYYTESHRQWRAKVRAFVEKEMIPYAGQWDEEGEYPLDLHRKFYDAGIMGAIFPKEYGGTPPEGFDAFHDLILADELARVANGGLVWALYGALTIALPPVLFAGSKYLKDWVARDCITGKKLISLAVTEPYAGSDVAGIRTTAVREGDYYIVNGQKKFITGGMKAAFYTTAVRTGGEGMGGISLLLIERETPGVKTTRLKTNGWWTSNTALITFDNVKVPVKNLIGKENQGFSYVMVNFNHERFIGAVTSLRAARTCLEDAWEYARVRKVFGKTLIEQPVIRQKLAEMARQVESQHALVEQATYQMKMKVSDQKLGGLMALCKVQGAKVMDFCAREASQVLGGNSCIRGGRGERIERIYREVRIGTIGGGSEEILLDLVVRQAMRNAKL